MNARTIFFVCATRGRSVPLGVRGLTRRSDNSTLRFVVFGTHPRTTASLLSVVAAGFLGSGCTSWSFWPFGPTKTAHESGSRPVSPVDSPFSDRRGSDNSSQSQGAIQVVDLAFDVMRVGLPVGGVRDSRKIWNHLDELRVDPDRTALLARNGFRVGVASSGVWPAIQTILDAAGASIASENLFPQRGVPLPIRLGSIDEDESVFSFGRDGRLVGKTFAAGDKVIIIDYALRPQLDGCVDLGVSFEIIRDNQQTVWGQRDGVLQQVPSFDRHRFEDLAALLTLHPGEFLVVGQSDEIGNEYLVGSRFLSERRSGERLETLILLSPQPYQAQTAQRSPS